MTITQVFAVRHRHPVFAKFAENVVGQFIDGLGHRDGGHLPLHLQQLVQRDGALGQAGRAALLGFQHPQAVVPLSDVLRHHLQFQPVVEGGQDLLLGVVEVGHLIGRREEGDGGDRV